jgi:hypothetical protein
MNKDTLMIRAFMQRLVEQAGGVDAAAALIGAATGSEPSKGTISKRMAGHLDWPVIEVKALEDALQDYRLRIWLYESMPHAREQVQLLSAVADAHKETGEALAAALHVTMGNYSISNARREVREAIAAQRKVEETLEGMEERL